MPDAATFTELYHRCHKRIHLYALGLCRDKHLARDLTQEAFKQLWEAFGRIADDRHAANYLYRAVRHLFQQHCRKARAGKKVILGLSTLADEAPELPEDLSVVTEEAYAALEAAIGRLSPQRHQVMELLFREELETDAVAGRLRVTAQTVRNTKTQLIDWLRVELKKNLFFE
jgi:RNA polymerase sigma factor (sigma-70 family)